MTRNYGYFCVQMVSVFYVCLYLSSQICFATDNGQQQNIQQKSPMTAVTEQATSSNVTASRSADDDKLIRRLFHQTTYKNFQRYSIIKAFEIKEPA